MSRRHSAYSLERALAILQAARAILGSPESWCNTPSQNDPQRAARAIDAEGSEVDLHSPRAVRWSLEGAVMKAHHDQREIIPSFYAAQDLLTDVGFFRLSEHDPETKHKSVLRRLDRAIGGAKLLLRRPSVGQTVYLLDEADEGKPTRVATVVSVEDGRATLNTGETVEQHVVVTPAILRTKVYGSTVARLYHARVWKVFLSEEDLAAAVRRDP